VEWIYNDGPAVFGFILDQDGYIDEMILVGEELDYARTAMWRPHQYVKLGDNYKRVLYRYGYPDRQVGFTGGTGAGVASTTSSYTRNVELYYVVRNNIIFTLHDMKVTRIRIWR
jgi:hypothetical protein